MSPVDSNAAAPSTTDLDLGVIKRQIVGVLRLELGKNFLGKRAWGMYFLAFSPLPIALLWAVTAGGDDGIGNPISAAPLFANAFMGFVGFSLYMSALLLFMSLFRSEIMEKSLHYYLLTPVRREVLVIGKYLSALVAIILTFSLATVILYLLTNIPWGFGEFSQYFFRGPGLGNLMGYLGMVAFACAGYGAIFLLAGMLFKNPVIPAAVFWGWEVISRFLPTMFKKLTVVHYLRSLEPFPIEEGPFAVVADPTPTWIAIPGIFLFTAGVLFIACWKARRMEVSYGDD